MFIPASTGSLAAFLSICAAIVFVFLGGIWCSARRDAVPPERRVIPVALGLALWVGLFLFIVASGWVEASGKRIPILAAFVILISILAGISRIGRWLAGSSLIAIIGFQAFRLPLELVLHSWAAQGVIPGTMTWTGANWDIISGMTALLSLPFVWRSTIVAWSFNIVGFVLLVNVVRVAILSSPVPFGWPVTPKLQLIYHVPYALIVSVCVGGALLGHVVLTRALLSRRAGK